MSVWVCKASVLEASFEVPSGSSQIRLFFLMSKLVCLEDWQWGMYKSTSLHGPVEKDCSSPSVHCSHLLHVACNRIDTIQIDTVKLWARGNFNTDSYPGLDQGV